MKEDYIVSVHCKPNDETRIYVIEANDPIDVLKYECGQDIMEKVAEWSKENSDFIMNDEFWHNEEDKCCGIVLPYTVVEISLVADIPRKTLGDRS